MTCLARTYRLRRGLAGVGFALCTTVALASTQVLYDPGAPGAPSFDPAAPAFGWLSGASFGAVTTSFSAQGALVSQTGIANTVGYSNHSALLVLFPGAPLVNAAFPQLDRNLGYRLTFGLDIDAEDHSGNPSRAGFSVTLIGHDKKGIEIGFQSGLIGIFQGGSVFAQNDSSSVTGIFSAGESASTAQGFSPNRWNLDVQANGYTLALASGGPPILSGTLRDYSNYVGTGQNAYRTADFLFLGDNTGSAGADFRLSYVAITTPVPEPSAYGMLLSGLALLGGVAWRRRVALA